MKCMYCNTEVPSSFKCCHHCGQPLARSLDASDNDSHVRIKMLVNVYCVNCLSPLPANARFCPKCGLQLNSRNGYPIDSEGNPTTTEWKPEPVNVEKRRPPITPEPPKSQYPEDLSYPEERLYPPKKDTLRGVFLFLCAIGICLMITGLCGKIATGSLANEIKEAGVFKEVEQDYGIKVSESMAEKFVVALMRNDPSRFSKELMGYAGSELGELGSAITGLSDLVIGEMFRVVRSGYNGSTGIWLIFQVSAYYMELLIVGAAIAFIFGLLLLIRRNSHRDMQAGKAAVVTVSIITACWIILVVICMATAVNAL